MYAAAGGLDLMVRQAEKLLRRNPSPDYAAQSAGDLTCLTFVAGNRPCGLFGTAGDRRSGTRNEDSSGTPDGHCRHRFAAGYYRESDFGGDGLRC